MRYVSTRGQAAPADFRDVLLAGLAPDGGLYVPEEWPAFAPAEIAAFAGTHDAAGLTALMQAAFDRIDRHFRPLAGPGSLNLEDDAAVFAPPPGRELVVTADAMVEGVHFLPGTEASLVAP